MKNLSVLNKTVDKLVRNGLFLPAFILKCQIIEYDLKRFIWNYCKLTGNCPKGGLTEYFLDRATIGSLFSKLKELEDSAINLGEFKDKVKIFKGVRNEFTHEIITSGKSYAEIEVECKKYLEIADELLEDTWFRLGWIEDFQRKR
jgi:hypothetical protein